MHHIFHHRLKDYKSKNCKKTKNDMSVGLQHNKCKQINLIRIIHCDNRWETDDELFINISMCTYYNELFMN